MADKNRFGNLFIGGLLGDQGAFRREKARQFQTEIEEAPLTMMAQSSIAADAIRQLLPYQAGDLNIVQAIANKLPGNFGQAVKNVRTGGMSPETRAERQQMRAGNPELAESTVVIGEAPVNMQGKAEALKEGDIAGRSAQVAGMAAGDILTDGMRNIWWFLNAPQAVSQIAVLQAMNNAKNANIDTSVRLAEEPLLKSRALRMAATAPAVIAVSMGLGNAYRQPGYKAVVPDENDPTKTANLGQELVDRYFLGRSGALLPYDEFVKERPDVSREEYNQYKNYLFGDRSVVKATMDGVQGPEVTFMGKSIPLMTGILPGVAGVLGARRGVKRGLQKLEQSGALDQEQKNRLYAAKLQERAADAARGGEVIKASEAKDPRKAERAYRARRQKNDQELFKQIIKDASVATTGAALSGALLESIRRANRPVQELDE